MSSHAYAQQAGCTTGNCETNSAYELKIVPAPPQVNTVHGKATSAKSDSKESTVNPVAQGSVWLSEDPTSFERVLNITAGNTATMSGNRFENPVTFKIRSNYPAFIKRWEIRVYKGVGELSAHLVRTINPGVPAGVAAIEWDGNSDGVLIGNGDELFYSLRAYGANDAFDETERQSITLIDDDEPLSASELPELSVPDESDAAIDKETGLVSEGIQLSGGKVRVLSQDLTPGHVVQINGDEYKVGKDGRVGVDYIVPIGEQSFDVVVLDADVPVLEKQLSLKLDPSYFFMVALADLTVGQNSVSGSIEPLAVDEQHYADDLFVDGRLAFYLKGKLKGKYLVTAQMDTGTEDVGKLLDNFHKKDPQSLFRRLDPDQYYPVYGDDATLIDDTDSQGKLYVRVDWDRSSAKWGNFNTGFTGTEFAQFNRSLYGAIIDYRSVDNTELNDTRTTASAFASRVQSLFRHNEFLGTGGSLYYLRDTDIVSGSEKVWVEVRQTNSSRVVSKIVLEPGRDYDIDDFQGRIILNRPLLSVSSQAAPSIIRDEPLAGNQTYLVVDYEYSPQSVSFKDTSAGVRSRRWLTDNVALGGTWVHEQRSDDDYDIKSIDLTIKRSDQSFIKAEIAQSESAQTASSIVSLDGGLSFNSLAGEKAADKGQALSIEARLSLADFKADVMPVEFAAWAKLQDAGFSTANNTIKNDTTEMGAEAAALPRDNITLSARISRVDSESVGSDSKVAAQIDYAVNDDLVVSGELRNTRQRSDDAGITSSATILAGKINQQVSDKLEVYGIHQSTLQKSGSAQRNDATTVGAKFAASENASVKGEASTGDKGDSVLLGTEINVSDTYSVYSNYTYSSSNENLDKNSVVLGQRKTIGSQLKVYSEHQFTDEDSRQGYAHTVGLDQQVNKFTSVSLSYQRALTESTDQQKTVRNTISTGIEYQNNNVRASSKLEYRTDDGPDTGLEQWVTSNRFEYRRTPSFRWQGKANASISDDTVANEDARFVELGIGFALRPVQHDRLNLLARLTFLDDLPPASQSSSTDVRSWVASIEGLYDMSEHWSIGGKFATRASEIRLQRNSGAWIGNDANLFGVRLRHKAPFGIDTMLSYRWLESARSDSVLQGALVNVGKQVGDHLRFAIGYNFTKFDDDLGNSSYDFGGWFFNLTGTY